MEANKPELSRTSRMDTCNPHTKRFMQATYTFDPDILLGKRKLRQADLFAPEELTILNNALQQMLKTDKIGASLEELRPLMDIHGHEYIYNSVVYEWGVAHPWFKKPDISTIPVYYTELGGHDDIVTDNKDREMFMPLFIKDFYKKAEAEEAFQAERLQLRLDELNEEIAFRSAIRKQNISRGRLNQTQPNISPSKRRPKSAAEKQRAYRARKLNVSVEEMLQAKATRSLQKMEARKEKDREQHAQKRAEKRKGKLLMADTTKPDAGKQK